MVTGKPFKADLEFSCGECTCVIEKNDTEKAKLRLTSFWHDEPDINGDISVKRFESGKTAAMQIVFPKGDYENNFLFIFDGTKVHKRSLQEFCR